MCVLCSVVFCLGVRFLGIGLSSVFMFSVCISFL